MPQKRKPNVGRRPDPDDNWNDPEIPVDDFLAQVERLKKKITEAPRKAWERSMTFFEDVEKRAIAIAETVKENRKVSTGQANAVNSWEAAVDKTLAKYVSK